MNEQDNQDVLSSHKSKWDALAKENDRYYVRSVDHVQSDEEYEESGQKHADGYLVNDPTIQKRLAPLSDRTLLEIGCGSGRITKTFAKRFKYVAALDISRTMLEKARGFVDSDNVIYLESNGEDVPLLPESVDVAFSFIVYQHFPNKASIEHSFKQVNRALKPGGLFKVQIRGIANPNPNHWAWGPHFLETEVAELALSTGFKIISSIGAGTQYYWLLLEK